MATTVQIKRAHGWLNHGNVRHHREYAVPSDDWEDQRKVPENKRIGYFRWGSGVKKQFRELYPTSRLLLAVNIFQALFLPTFAVGAWVILHS